MGIHRKKKHPQHKKSPAEFGAALAQARKEADYIFKQASLQDSNNSNSTTPPPGVSSEVSPRSKAAAWAWYQRGGGSSAIPTSTNPEDVRNRAMVLMRRSSRFKAEALRVNGSYTAEDTLVKAEHKWDPSQSLFDSFELLCVAKELDKALKGQELMTCSSPLAIATPAASSLGRKSESRHAHLVSLTCSSPSFIRRWKNSNAKEVSSAAAAADVNSFTGLLSRLIPVPVLCLSEADIATVKGGGGDSKRMMMRRGSSLGSTAFGRISRMLMYSPSSKSATSAEELVVEEEEDGTLHHHRHEHFHHHHHHHHHHESLVGDY